MYIINRIIGIYENPYVPIIRKSTIKSLQTWSLNNPIDTIIIDLKLIKKVTILYAF